MCGSADEPFHSDIGGFVADNTDDMKDRPFDRVGFMVERGARIKREVGIPTGVSWNLGIPALADDVIRKGLVDLVFLGRPALANPHWPLWAARELGHSDPFSTLPEDWAWWLRKPRSQAAADTVGLPPLPRSPSGLPN